MYVGLLSLVASLLKFINVGITIYSLLILSLSLSLSVCEDASFRVSHADAPSPISACHKRYPPFRLDEASSVAACSLIVYILDIFML